MLFLALEMVEGEPRETERGTSGRRRWERRIWRQFLSRESLRSSSSFVKMWILHSPAIHDLINAERIAEKL